MGMLRPPILPPSTSGFFMPPVQSGGFIPQGMPRMPIPNMPIPQPTTTTAGTANENGGQLRTQIKMQPPE